MRRQLIELRCLIWLVTRRKVGELWFGEVHVVETQDSKYTQELPYRSKYINSSYLSTLHTVYIQECGSNYTSKLEGMFQDIELSRDVLSAYQQHKTAAGLIVKSLSFTDHSVPSPSSGDAVYASEFIATVTPSERRKLITPEFHAQVSKFTC